MARTKNKTTVRRSASIAKKVPRVPARVQAAKNVATPHHFRPRTRALLEIRRCQSRTDLIDKHLGFRRVVREIAEDIKPGLRWKPDAVDALQEGAEAYLVELMEDAILCAIHAKRITIMDKVFKLALVIRGKIPR